MGGLKKTSLLVVVAFALLVPGPVEATEEKPVSMEAVMEEISALRTLIAEQQRQIERLQNALNIPAVVPAVGSPVAQAQTPVPSAEDVSKRLESVAGGLAGFKFSGDFRLRADGQARSSHKISRPRPNIPGRVRLLPNVGKGIDPQI